MTGSYTQAGSGRLDETFSGPGINQASLLAVNGAVALGGTLELSLLNGARLANGDDIVVATATPGALSGTFATIVDGGLSAAGNSSIAIGNGLYLVPVYDDSAGVMRLLVSATAATPPVITAPTTALLNAGTTAPISGISVSAESPGTISVRLADAFGLLDATAAAGATVSGDGSTGLTLVGSVAAVNQELASLTDSPQGSATTDQLTITATDSALQVASDTIDVSIDQPPTITLPAAALEAPGQPDPLSGISVADPTLGVTLTAVLSDSAGLLAATASGAGSVAGDDSTRITLTGTLADLNAELAGLSFSGSASDTLSVAVSDGRGGAASATLAIAVSPPPTLTVPSGTQTEFNGVTQTLTGLAVTAPTGAPAGVVYTVTLAAQFGLLAALASGGATVAGNGTALLTLTGTVAGLNAALGTLAYTGPSSGAADTITFATPNGRGGTLTESVAVSLSATPPSVSATVTPTTVNFGTVHAGVTLDQAITVDNTGSTPIAATIGVISGDATAAGSINQLAADMINQGSIVVGLSTSRDGNQSGAVTLAIAPADEPDVVAAAPTVAVSGSIFNLATPAVTIPANIILHAGDPGTLAISIGNAAAADGYSENLIAALTGVSGGVTIAAGGSTGEIAPGATDAGVFQLDFSTAQAGNINATATLALTSDGGTGAGSIDGLSQTTLAAQTITIDIAIDNDAKPVLQLLPGSGSLGSIGGSGQAQTLDLGTFEQNTGSVVVGLGVLNDVAAPADNLSGGIAATGSFVAAGFGTIADLAAGNEDTAPKLTLDTVSDGVFTEKVTLTPEDSNPSGYSAALPAQTLTVTGTVADLPPPVITVARTLIAIAAVPGQLGTIAVADPNAVTQPLTVTVTDGVGTLDANASGDGSVSGNNTNTLILIGDLVDLNNELASLTYLDPTTGSDSITITVTDQHHAAATEQVAVTTEPVPVTPPVVNVPTSDTVVVGALYGLGGLSVSDPYAQATGAPVTLSFQAPAGVSLVISGPPGATITGQGTNSQTITGTVDQLNADLADGQGIDWGSALVTAYLSFANNVLAGLAIIATGAAFASVGSQAANLPLYLLGQAVTRAATALVWSVAIRISVANTCLGDAHIDSFSGQLLDFNATGEFILAKSTLPGDSFQVQQRLEPLNGNTSATVITQIAAQVGTDRVTFGVGRGATVWVDGSAVSLNEQTPVNLSGGQLTQTGTNSYQITWNTGEVLVVADNGNYLDLKLGLSVGDGPGSTEGLAGPNEGAANDFTLPDGTVLAQPLSAEQLYTTFANAWRVTQADSLLDYGPGQTTATFTPAIQTIPLTLADLPADAVAAAAQLVAAAGITDPQTAAVAEYDYLATGDVSFVTTDAGALQGLTTTAASVTQSGSVPAVLGIYAADPTLVASETGTTAAVFNLYLTSAASADTVVDYSVVTSGTDDLQAAAFGGVLPSGTATIAAGQTSGSFTIDLPQSVLGSAANANLQVQITDPGGPAIFDADSEAVLSSPQPGAAPDPVLSEVTTFGDFSEVAANTYNLDLGLIPISESIPPIQFDISNAAADGADQLGGSIAYDTVAGFTVAGAGTIAPIDPGEAYSGLTVNVEQAKFGPNEETVTFNPVDTNPAGYTALLSPITLNVSYTLEAPTMAYSEAWGDVHIVTYNGLLYNFQAEGEFVLAHSIVPGDSFDIQLRLQQYSTGALVSVITQAALGVGSDRVTFDTTRPDFVAINGSSTQISLANPTIILPGGTLTELTSTTYQVTWNTGETATITNAGRCINVYDGIPVAETGAVSGLQGENEGQANDFQLPDGTVLPQPLSTSTLYGEYANAWRVSQATSLFDYLPGQTTATFTDANFPSDVVSLAELPASSVTQAAQMVAAARITDPGVAQSAELDYLATGDPSFIASAASVQQIGFTTNSATITPSAAPVVAVGVTAAEMKTTAAANGETPIAFTVYLTAATTVDTSVSYAVVAPDATYLGPAAFGGSLPSGQVTIGIGQTTAQATIDIPQGALGNLPSDHLGLQVSAPSGDTLFAPIATAEIVNPVAEPGAPPLPEIA